MATYKVPQDVEAEDKLLGPFTFRQFIYLLIVAGSVAIAYGLSRIFIGLAVIPLPVIIFFGALALPLRKDQPMEVYLAAMVSFYLKPRKRMWDPDGIDSLIEITAPRTVDVQRVKDITQDDAQQRFSYLADLVDSEGWAVRGQGVQAPSTTSMNTDAYFTAQEAPDILADDTSVSQTLDYKIAQSDAKRHEEMMARMHQPAAEPTPPSVPPVVTNTTPVVDNAYTVFTPPASQQASNDAPTYNPYPTIQQKVIQPPQDDAAHQFGTTPTPTITSEKQLSPDIMNLATNTDLSVETIAREANRIQKKEDDLQDGVVLSLR